MWPGVGSASCLAFSVQRGMLCVLPPLYSLNWKIHAKPFVYNLGLSLLVNGLLPSQFKKKKKKKDMSQEKSRRSSCCERGKASGSTTAWEVYMGYRGCPDLWGDYGIAILQITWKCYPKGNRYSIKWYMLPETAGVWLLLLVFLHFQSRLNKNS